MLSTKLTEIDSSLQFTFQITHFQSSTITIYYIPYLLTLIMFHLILPPIFLFLCHNHFRIFVEQDLRLCKEIYIQDNQNS